MPSLPITVFTPTYNRAATLTRVFDSLKGQNAELFEWLVVDDGSTDHTSEVLQSAKREAAFDVRIVKQANGGKHRAHNTAVQIARGELTVIVDSDDELVPGAVQDIWEAWTSIPNDKRTGFAGVIGHSVDATGQLVGDPFPASPLDAKYFDLAAENRMTGEKLPCYRTDLLRRFPFPELPGSNAYVPEGTVWIEIGKTHILRCVNRTLRVYHRDSEDPNAIMNRYAAPQSNAWGRMQYLRAILNLHATYFARFPRVFIKAAAGYVRYALHAGQPLRVQRQQLQGSIARALWLGTLPVGLAAYLADRLRRH